MFSLIFPSYKRKCSCTFMSTRKKTTIPRAQKNKITGDRCSSLGLGLTSGLNVNITLALGALTARAAPASVGRVCVRAVAAL